jgi:hypothetical protein
VLHVSRIALNDAQQQICNPDHQKTSNVTPEKQLLIYFSIRWSLSL